MDKNAIKKYAIWARNELIARIAQKAAKFGVLEKNSAPASADSINGVVLTNVQKKQRQALLAKIEEQGYEQTIEEVAYTWFNRFIALRFMEVNNYLPSRVRVFTDSENNFKPEIMSEAINMDLDGINVDHIYGLKDANMDEELFRYMLVLQCNALNKILPVMFQKLEDYTELLLPDNLLREGSVIEKLVNDIPEQDWQDQVQIIGWLYQYYNTEPKDKVFANLKKNIKISKENIPAATQLFTPDWIVRYMVENSLGRLWVEGHPNDELKANWKYYLEEAEQEPEVQAQLAEIRKEYAQLQPEDLLCIDPCQGSGHILCYMFDVLMQIYEAYGYTSKEAVKNIVEKNIWGLDIDERASQLAYFSVMMKARQYDRRFFSHIVQPNVFAIEESNGIDKNLLQYFGYGMDELSKNVVRTQLEGLLAQMHDAKEYGSIINVDNCDWNLLKEFVSEYDAGEAGLFDAANLYEVQERLHKLVCVAQTLGQKYHAVVTNPPYITIGKVNAKINNFLNSFYADSKFDFFAVFIEKCSSFTFKNGFFGMITQQSWMFDRVYNNLRSKLYKKSLICLNQLGARGFDEIGGEVVQTASFVYKNTSVCKKYCTVWNDLTYGVDEKDKERIFVSKERMFFCKCKSFYNLPGQAMAYWMNRNVLQCFDNLSLSSKYTTREGMTTADNERFVRNWPEVNIKRIGVGLTDEDEFYASSFKWAPYNKGGANRKWYGNNDLVVNWENRGYEIKNLLDADSGRIRSHNYNAEYSFAESCTWTAICSGQIMVRYSPNGFLFDSKGASLFAANTDELIYVIGLLNSKVSNVFLKLLSSKYEFKVGHVANVPLKFCSDKIQDISNVVLDCIKISRHDWDSYETSWDFKRHILVPIRPFGVGQTNVSDTMSGAYEFRKKTVNDKFEQLKANEEKINSIFIDIYGLQEELTPEVEEKEVTIHKIFDSKEDVPESMKNSNYVLTKQDVVKSFISYAVGCMFGRYSLDVEGLAYAGGDWNEACGIQEGDKKVAAHDWQYGGKYKTFAVDPDNIIPICDDEYFDDDIVGRFIDFVKTVYGAETLEENLKFIADALGGKGSSREIIRTYFLNSFYADHCKTYQKRPIYWLFDSGKKNGFKCLIYMHRYAKDTIARIRTDYVHEQQARYRTAIEGLESRIAIASTSERVKLNKQLAVFQAKAEELHDYEEKIHHYADAMIDIDLDDGVKVNYAKFADVLAKVK